MLEQFFWNVFEKTGSVDAYLGIKDCCNNNDENIVSQDIIQDESQNLNQLNQNEEMW